MRTVGTGYAVGVAVLVAGIGYAVNVAIWAAVAVFCAAAVAVPAAVAVRAKLVCVATKLRDVAVSVWA